MSIIKKILLIFCILIIFCFIDLFFFTKKQNMIILPFESIEQIISERVFMDFIYLNKYPEEDKIFIFKYAIKYDIPIEFIYRQDYIESKFNQYAISPLNCYGYKQLNIKYIDYFIEKYFIYNEEFNVFNKKHNIQVGLAYLADLYNYFENWELAFQAYHAGINNVKYNKIGFYTKAYSDYIVFNDNYHFK